MNNTRNIIVVACGVAAGLGVGYAIGAARGAYAEASRRDLAAQLEASIKQRDEDRRSLNAIDEILARCETIHGDRHPDGVWTFAMFRPDGTAREVDGRTLDVLIGGAR